MTRSLRSAVPPLALLAGFLLPAAPDAQLTRAFPEAPELLAIQVAAPGTEPDPAELSRAAGLAIAGVRRYGPRDVFLLELAAPAGRPERRAAVFRLAALQDVSFATIVRRDDEYELPMLPTQRILIRFLPDVPDVTQRAMLGSLPGIAVESELFGGMIGAWSLSSAAATGEEVLDQVDLLAALPGVKWVESDRVLGGVDHDVIPNDPLFDTCWGLHNTGQMVGGVSGQADFDMDAPEAWDLGLGDESVLVMVMDSGTQLYHPDLNLAASGDFTDEGSSGGPHNECSNHGTAVAGCISAIIDNGLGTTGIAPGCSLVAVAVHVANEGNPCPGTWSGKASWKVNALNWADIVGVRVTNSSFGAPFSSAWSDKLAETRAGGMVHFASSGNNGTSSIGFPANDPSVLAIGAVQNDGQLADFSSPACPGCGSTTGPELDLVAPGKAIVTTDRTGADGYAMGDYATIDGTSFASPYAAGVAALVISRHPSITPGKLELVLQMSARDLGAKGLDNTFGHGMVNANAALLLADEILPEMQVGLAFVDAFYPFTLPPFFKSVGAAVQWVPAGGAVIIRGGSFSETLLVAKDVTLYRWGAPAVVGQ